MSPNPNHSVRRILLPSGRTIEVVRFDDERCVAPGLHLCPDCTSELVQPIAWAEAEAGHWELTLRCPNCGSMSDGVFQQEQVEQLEERLDEGVEAILRDLKRLTHANMTDHIERFAAALQSDLILPEDF